MKKIWSKKDFGDKIGVKKIQDKWGPKQFWCKDMLGPKIGSTKLLLQKNCVQRMLGQQNFESEKLLSKKM